MKKGRLALLLTTAAMAASVPMVAGSSSAATLVTPAPSETGHIYINQIRNFVDCNYGSVTAVAAGNDPRQCSITVP